MYFLSFLFLLSLTFPILAKEQTGQSIYQHCKQQGYTVGTIEFEECCKYQKDRAEKEAQERTRKNQILGRDFAGKIDHDRIRREELDCVPRKKDFDFSGPYWLYHHRHHGPT